MERFTDDILFFLFSFFLVFTINYLWSWMKIKKRKTKKVELLQYLIQKFDLDEKKIKPRQRLLALCLINAFIIAFVATFISILELNFMWKILIGFVLVFSLMYALYELYGRYLIKKGFGKNKEKKGR